MNYLEFSKKIKEKYPQYSDIDDRELAEKIIKKYPEYSDITFDVEPGKQEGVQTAAATAIPFILEEPQQPQTSKASGYIWEDGSIKQYEVKSKKDEEEEKDDKKTFADLIKEQKIDTKISIEGQKAFEERIQMLPEEVAAREILNQGDVMSPEYRQAFDLVKNAEQSRKLPESEKYKKAKEKKKETDAIIKNKLAIEERKLIELGYSDESAVDTEFGGVRKVVQGDLTKKLSEKEEELKEEYNYDQFNYLNRIDTYFNELSKSDKGDVQTLYDLKLGEKIDIQEKVKDEIINTGNFSQENIDRLEFMTLAEKENILTSAKSSVLDNEAKKADEYISNILESAEQDSINGVLTEEKSQEYEDQINKIQGDLLTLSGELKYNITENLFSSNFQATDLYKKKQKEFSGIEHDGVVSFSEGTVDVVSRFIQEALKTTADATLGTSLWLSGLADNALRGDADGQYTGQDYMEDLYKKYITNSNYFGVDQESNMDMIGGEGNLFRRGAVNVAEMLPFTLGLILQARKGNISGVATATRPTVYRSILKNASKKGLSAKNYEKVRNAFFQSLMTHRLTLLDNKFEADDIGLKGSDAYLYAETKSLATSLIQSINPDINLLGKNKSIISSTISNAIKTNASNKAKKQAAQSAVTGLVRNFVGENTEEQLELLSDEATKIVFGVNMDEYSNYNDAKTVLETVAATSALTSVFAPLGARADYKKTKASVYKTIQLRQVESINGVNDAIKKAKIFLNKAKKNNYQTASKWEEQIKNLEKTKQDLQDIIFAVNATPDFVTAEEIDLNIEKNKILKEQESLSPNSAKYKENQNKLKDLDTKIEDGLLAAKRADIYEEITNNVKNILKNDPSLSDVKLQEFENAEQVNKFIEENNIDSEKFDGDQEGVIASLNDEKIILIDKEAALKNRKIGVAQHELFHAITVDALAANPNAAIEMSQFLLTEMAKLDESSLSLLGYTPDQIGQFTIATYKNQGKGVIAEELLTAYLDGISNGWFKYNKSDADVIGNVFRRFINNFTPFGNTSFDKFKSGKEVVNFLEDFNSNVKSGKLGKRIQAIAEESKKIKNSKSTERQSKTALGDSIKALVPEGTTKAEYDSEVIGTAYLDLIASNKLHPLINNNLARFGVPKEQVTDEFYEDVKNQLFERSLQRFNPEVNDDLGGFVINELQRFAIPDIVNQYKDQGRFRTTEQVEAAPTEGRVRPMQIAEETTTEEVIERAEEQEAKVEEKTFREKLGIKEGSNVYNSVVESVRRTFGTRLPSVTDKKFRAALIKSFKTDLMKPMKDFIGKKERYRDFVFNNFNSIMGKIPTREWVRLEQQESNKIFAELVTARASTEEVDDAVSKGLYLLPGASRVSGTSIYRKLDTTPEQLWKFLASNNAQINGARKTALTERLVQELAFDATMMVLKDPKYNAFARAQEIAELTGGTLPANFSAELGAVIERDPSITRFSSKKQNEALEAIASMQLFTISPGLIDQDIVKFISQLAGTFGYLSQPKEDIEALSSGKKGARTRAINGLKNTFEKFNTGQSFEDFIKGINRNDVFQNIIPNLLNSYNKLDNGKKYETIFVVKGNSLLNLLKSNFEFRLSPEQGFDVELYDKDEKIVLDKIELKYGSPENGPWLTSVVYNSIFNKNGKLNGDGKTARDIGSSKDFLIQTINEEGNKKLIEEFVKKAKDAGAKINNSGNGFDFETTEQREKFEKSLDENKPLIIAEKDGITNEKQLSEFGKGGMTMHYSEGNTYQVGSMNEKGNLEYNNSTIPEFKADLYNKIMFSRSENNYSLRAYLQVKELKLSPENNKNIEDSNTLKSYIESVTTQFIKTQDDLKKSSNVRTSKKHRGQYEISLAKRRGDLNKEQITEQVDSIFNWLDTTDVPNQKKKKFEELALFYMYQPGFILPEDGFKIIEAERIASIKGIDPRSYSNPTELINEFGDTVKKAYINPSKVSTLTRIEGGNNIGIDLYEVDNSKKGQDDLADIVESHLGRKTSPWCITAKKDGKVNREIWDEYGNYKVAAFKDGKIHAIGVGSKPVILSDNKSMAFLQQIEIPYTRETFDLYYDSTTDDLAIEYFNPTTSSKTFYEWDEVSSYFDFEGPSLDRESFKAIGRSLFQSENKNIAFVQKITLPSTGETFDIYYNSKKDNLEIGDSYGNDYKVNEVSKYFIEDGVFFDQEYFKATGKSIFKDGKAKGVIDNWWDRRDVPHKQIPTNTIRFSKKAKDAKGVAKDEKAKETLDQAFNTILEQRTGIKAAREYSKAQARAAAQKKKYRSFYIPPSAEDFLGLMYAFLSPGKKGEQQLKFFKDSLITPMNEAFNDWAQAKYVVARDFKALLKKHKGVRKRLNKFIPNTDFTIDQAIRIYLYDKAGHSVPGISEAELKIANNFVIENQDIYDFANELRPITRIPEGFKKPDENWIASTLTSEMYEISQEVVRSQFFEKVNENIDTIFNENNLNKIEAYYGPKFREALEDSIYSIKTGSKRSFGSDNRHLNEFNDWLNGSVGVIMFLNSRSAVLQTISSINYINWSDNNIAKAALAFANQKQFWSDFVYLFNSPYLKERRSGLQSDINLAELQASVATSKNKAKAAIKYLLEKGFIFTKAADSFAIASGGATFYRNRVKTYTKQGLSQKEAEAKAFTDFQNLTETNQQSSRPDKISQQQRGPLGRVILAFQNTPGQYGREIKKASLDLINGRGDVKTNISKIVYYGAVQNLIFNALQTGLFALLFDDDNESDEQWFDQKGSKVANGIIDTILRGTGITGAIIATTKNVILEWVKQQSKGWNSDYGEIIVEALNISPPLGSKARRLKVAHDILKYDSDLVKAYGYDIDNPLVDASANIISATTNVPLDRMLRKIDNVSAALDADNEIWQRIAMTGGWNTWDVGVEDVEKEELEAKVKEEKKQAKKEAKKEAKKPKGNDPVPTYNRKTIKRRTTIKRR